MNGQPYLIFYDAQCRICRRGRQAIERFHPTVPVRFVDSNDPQEMARYPQIADAIIHIEPPPQNS